MAEGERSKGVTPAACRNCGAALVGRFCPGCGQDSTLALRPWRELLAEWSDAVLGLETRTGRTVRALLFEPGRLTLEYAAGRRASWIHPLRVYLGANLVAFAVFGATSEQVLEHSKAALGPGGELWHLGTLLLKISAAFVVLVPAGAASYALALRDRGRYYAEHLAFVLHFSAFAFTVHAAASLVQWLEVMADLPTSAVSVPRVAAHILCAAYLWSAARRVYGLGAWATLFRITLASLLFAPVAALAVWLMTR